MNVTYVTKWMVRLFCLSLCVCGLWFFSSSNQNLTADCAIYYMYLLSRIVSSLWANECHVTANVKESGKCLYEYDCSGFWTFREWLVHIYRQSIPFIALIYVSCFTMHISHIRIIFVLVVNLAGAANRSSVNNKTTNRRFQPGTFQMQCRQIT